MAKPIRPDPKPSPSLNFMVAAAFTSLSAVLLLISGGLLFLTNLKTQEKIISSNQQLVAEDATKTVSNFVQEKISVLNTAIWSTDLAKLPADQQDQTLESLLGLQPAFRQIAYVSEEGQIQAKASRISSKNFQQFGEHIRPYLQSQPEKDQVFISPVYFDPLTSEPLVILSVPVVDALKDKYGALFVEMNLKFMWDMVDHLTIGEAGYAYVVDHQGNLLALDDTARVLRGENLSRVKVVKDFIDGKPDADPPGLVRYNGINERTVVGIYKPLTIPDWAVIVELPWEEAYQPIIRDGIVSLGIIFAMVLLSGLLGVYQARRLALPLVHLTETAAHIARGEWSLQADTKGPKEIASLATAFNSMTSQLHQSLESLEQKVIDVKHAEESLRRANETLQALFDYAPLSIIMLDPDGIPQMWNRAAERTFGWTAEEIIGKYPPTIPENQDSQFHQILERVKNGELITNLEVERRRKDGTMFPFSLSMAPVRDRESNIYAQISIGTDITERKRIEQSLLRTQFTIDHTKEAILWIGSDGRLSYVNQAACDILEYSKDEIKSVTIFDIDDQFSTEMWPEHWEKTRFHSAEKIQATLKTKTGRTIPVEISSNYIDYAGEEYHTAIIQDITERKKAEAALKESELKFRSVVQNAQAIIFILDLQGNFILSEGKGLGKLGLKPGEVVGKSALDIYKDYPSVTESIKKALKGNLVNEINELKEATFDTVYSPYFNLEGEVSGVVGIAIDISDQRKAEAALRLASFALQHVADAVYWINSDGQIEGANEAACQMLGYTFDELTQMTIMDIDPVITIDVWRKYWADLRANQALTRERQQRTKTHQIIQVEVLANLIVFGGRELDCALVRDITERKQAEEKILRLNSELEERVRERTKQWEDANKELEAFAYTVSHDLRAPLRAIDGYTQILVEDYESILDDDGKRVSSIIRQETRRMGQLIDDLLSFSRLNRAEMQSTLINMENMAQVVFMELTKPEERERITFNLAHLHMATGDSSMIHQIWANLLSNAIKFSQYRERAVISVESMLSDNEVIYSVSDNGAGFDMQYVNKLFGVFQRLHNEKEFEGTGVGLAIAQRVIHRHGGRIWAQGEVDKGATFWFSMPNKGENE